MGKEKSEGAPEKNAHKFALGARAVAAVSVVLAVPVLRRLRAHRHERRRHRRLLLGH